MLAGEWRRLAIPEWRRVLQEAIRRGEKRRQEYARWMLREVLQDPEYREGAEVPSQPGQLSLFR